LIRISEPLCVYASGWAEGELTVFIAAEREAGAGDVDWDDFIF
jgi:hypothetical protein